MLAAVLIDIRVDFFYLDLFLSFAEQYASYLRNGYNEIVPSRERTTRILKKETFSLFESNDVSESARASPGRAATTGSNPKKFVEKRNFFRCVFTYLRGLYTEAYYLRNRFAPIVLWKSENATVNVTRSRACRLDAVKHAETDRVWA